MTASFSIDEILSLKGAHFLGSPEGLSRLAHEKLEIITDSRVESHKVGSGAVYLALTGERFDGHDFVKAALAKENVFKLALCQETCAANLGSLREHIVYVPDTLKAYQELAKIYRLKSKAKVIAITGSSGKTTTKEFFGTVFSQAFVTHKSQANENNEIGVPKTILAMPEDCQILIVEMGMRGAGQIRELAEITRPDIGVITSIGTAHIELLGTRENIAQAKCELLHCLDRDKGLAILGADDDLSLKIAGQAYSGTLKVVARNAAKIVKTNSAGTYFQLDGGQMVFFVPVHGEYLLQDACLAVEAAHALGVSDELLAQGLREFEPVEGRGKPITLPSGAVIIDETYNANPDSMKCAVHSVVSSVSYQHLEKVLVLAKMAELGEATEALHEELGQWLKEQPVGRLLTIGPLGALIAKGALGAPYMVQEVADQDEAFALLRNLLNQPVCIVIKGSHSTQLDKLVERLVKSA